MTKFAGSMQRVKFSQNCENVLIICFGCSKETSPKNRLIEYPQYMYVWIAL